MDNETPFGEGPGIVERATRKGFRSFVSDDDSAARH